MWLLAGIWGVLSPRIIRCIQDKLWCWDLVETLIYKMDYDIRFEGCPRVLRNCMITLWNSESPTDKPIGRGFHNTEMAENNEFQSEKPLICYMKCQICLARKKMELNLFQIVTLDCEAEANEASNGLGEVGLGLDSPIRVGWCGIFNLCCLHERNPLS